METIEEPALSSSVDSVKTITCEENNEPSEVAVEEDICHKSNGVVESADAGHSGNLIVQNATETDKAEEISPCPDSSLKDNDGAISCNQSSAQQISEGVIEVSEEVVPEIIESLEMSAISAPVTGAEENLAHSTSEPDEPFVESQENLCIVQCNDVEVNEGVTFETEILVESNINDINENESKLEDGDPNTNILSELGPNIELSEALRSSDVADAVENNNCAAKQEMFNKEELLDILEGNDVAESMDLENVKNTPNSKKIEAQLALQQLSRLKGSRKKTKRNQGLYKIPKKCKGEVKIASRSYGTPEVATEHTLKVTPEVTPEVTLEVTPEAAPKATSTVTPEVNKEENIVNVLVKDWDDDEPNEEEQTTVAFEESQLLEDSEISVKSQEFVSKQDEALDMPSADSSTSDGQITNMNKSEEQPLKRHGRVIKKKVIFDPDNPDTYTKNKAAIKGKDVQGDKEPLPTPTKKIKIEQIIQMPKSKSPISKMQWKKPCPKNNKQNKRLTEVDKLLMDEGAVNMIYQLTPEAPKGKKNMKTKAEFIKKIQSSTPDSKEMKFRERKKDAKYEEGEARKILGGKLRPSLNSSVKSPSVCEDFEAHSADDSIIYRRHSSSSYSSSCMSPRRLSDVEGGQSAPRQTSDSLEHAAREANNTATSDVFMGDQGTVSTREIINKDDCLSIKEKLNSKLSLALNKRKREDNKLEKPSKSKKIAKDVRSHVISENITDLKHLSVNIDDSLAEICIHKSGSMYTIEVMRELEKVLSDINLNKTVSVTLLSSESGTLCSGLDLKPLLNENSEEQSKYALELAESMRRVCVAVWAHGKVVVGGAARGGAGPAAALLAACDVALASDRATFALPAPLQPAAALLAAKLPAATVNEMLLGRVLSAGEAVQAGLLSRALWPRRFPDQLRAVAADIAAQPPHNLLMKKKLMQLSRENTFERSLEKERDLFVEYWTSAAGRDAVRAALATT